MITVGALLAGMLYTVAMIGSAARADESANGVLTVIWGDPHPSSDDQTVQLLTVAYEDGRTDVFDYDQGLVDQLGGTVRLNNQPVHIRIVESDGFLALEELQEMDPAAIAAPQAITGSRRWISLPCRFAGNSSEPRNLSYFNEMYRSSYPGLDHYWREQSYDQINLIGSGAIDWVDLPHARDHYLPGGNADLGALFFDCASAADPFVDFSLYEGIQLMFNDNLDCCAWGGGWHTTLDGVTKTWRMAWLPPWAYQNLSVAAHEIGHGFGLPHSNNSDRDDNPYDNPWDVMSGNFQYNLFDATFGTLGQHTNSYHKDSLGWFKSQRRLDLFRNGTYSFIMDPITSSSADDRQMVRVRRRGDAAFLYIESRAREGYDGNLPDAAINIYEVRTGRSEPAWLVDGSSPPADFSDTEGVMWRPGETFIDPSLGIHIDVEQHTVGGTQITVHSDQTGPLYISNLEEVPPELSIGGQWHLTSACRAADAGHSPATALFFGNDSQCNYVSGSPESGLAILPGIDISGVLPPFTLSFNYNLGAANGDFAWVYYYDEGNNDWNVLASNLQGWGLPLPDTAGSWAPFSAVLPLNGAKTTGVFFLFSADGVNDDQSGFYVDDIVIDGCFAANTRVLQGVQVNGSKTYEACKTITAGAGYTVGATADVVFRAGSSVHLTDGFVVREGGKLVVMIAPPQND